MGEKPLTREEKAAMEIKQMKDRLRKSLGNAHRSEADEEKLKHKAIGDLVREPQVSSIDGI